MTLFLPLFFWRGQRYRCRARFVSPWRVCKVVDRFPQGDVVRLWCGPVLITCMIDSEGGQQ